MSSIRWHLSEGQAIGATSTLNSCYFVTVMMTSLFVSRWLYRVWTDGASWGRQETNGNHRGSCRWAGVRSRCAKHGGNPLETCWWRSAGWIHPMSCSAAPALTFTFIWFWTCHAFEANGLFFTLKMFDCCLMPGHGAFVSDFQLTWFDLTFDFVNITRKMRMALF